LTNRSDGWGPPLQSPNARFFMKTGVNKRRIISFSLYGDNPKYQKGALDNLRLAHELYPGWTCRFHVSQGISPSIVCKLKEEGGEVITKIRKDGVHGTFWRFLPASDRELDILLVRDIDSRLSKREVLAVQEWIKSGKRFHIMRDHPFHIQLIMAGMWGCRGNILYNLPRLVWLWRLMRLITGQRAHRKGKGQDQVFLSQMVYPRIKNDVLIHSEYVCFEGEQVCPFPSPRKDFEFVGEIINADGKRIERHLSALKKQGMKVYPMPDVRLIARYQYELHRLKRRFGGCA
jgi:hypothetical protein